jgi:hypothetical protein
MNVSVNYPSDTFGAIDKGLPRQTADQLSTLPEYANCSRDTLSLAPAVIKLICQYRQGKIGTMQLSSHKGAGGRRTEQATDQQILDFLEKNEGFLEFVHECHLIRQKSPQKFMLGRSSYAFYHWLIATTIESEEACYPFFYQFWNEGSKEGSPQWLLRRKLQIIKQSPTQKISSIDEYKLVIYAWNKYAKGIKSGLRNLHIPKDIPEIMRPVWL